MKFRHLLSIFAILVVGVVFSAQLAQAEKAKPHASSNKKQTRAEFNESIFKLYKAHKQELKDLQIQFINKQFSNDIENEKAIVELKNKINPAAGPEKNKEIMAAIEKKGKEFQEKNKKDSEEFYGTKMAEKGKAFYEKVGKLSREFEETQQPVKQGGAPTQQALQPTN